VQKLTVSEIEIWEFLLNDLKPSILEANEWDVT